MRNPTLFLTHPEAKKERLLKLADEFPGAWLGIKIAALLLCLEGQRPGWITEVLGLSRMSLTRWMHGVNERGLEALKPKPRLGKPPRLEPKVLKALEAHLEKSPQDFGLNRVSWDGPSVVVHLKRDFCITLKVRQAQRWMRRLGYRLKRAGYSHLQAKPSDARRFERALNKTPVPGV